VRHLIQELDMTALTTTATQDPSADATWHSRVTHRDGRAWEVTATRAAGDAARPESCGKAAVPTWTWDFVVN